jgi:hypothetical protein
MNFNQRLKQLEMAFKPRNIIPEPQFDFEQFVCRLGLEPSAVHESSVSRGFSLIEAMCEMLEVDVREFKRDLQEAANLVR